MSVLTVISTVLVFAGVIVFAGAGVGIVKFRDAYMRASAVGTAAGLGIALITIGAVLTMPTAENLVKAAIAVLLQLATSAVGTTLIGRSAVSSGHAFTPGTDLTDLEQADADALAAMRGDEERPAEPRPAEHRPAGGPDEVT